MGFLFWVMSRIAVHKSIMSVLIKNITRLLLQRPIKYQNIDVYR